MANNSIEYKTAKKIEDGLCDARLNHWSFAAALAALDGNYMADRIVRKLIIPYTTLKSIEYSFGNFDSTEHDSMLFCKRVRTIAIEMNMADDIQPY